ncbi:MAG: molybdopterin-synthase adenylyltransferase MoeB [Flavobacteriales bacterium]|nr:molybdopterin-synthase adenylyltransferase MoeB [Flavobacteriales bacterium]
MTFSREELARYDRHIIIPEFNIEGQKKLKAAKVLVIGSGGLGSPLLQYLAAAGVGTIGIVDYDVVDDSNLQRQVLFDVKDVGRPKVEAARDRILGINPHITVHTYNTQFHSSNALDIIRDKDYDIVADGTDNFPTRYLVNDACVIAGKVNVYGSIFRFDGQVAVFNYTDKDGVIGPNYRDLFPTPPPPGLVPSCAEGGVLGVLPGIIGSLQANEVIKVITGLGDVLSGKLYLFDALSFESRTLKVRKNEQLKITELIDYEQFCGLKPDAETEKKMKEISVQELKAWKDNNEEFQLIDVREAHEYEIVNLNGELMPLSQLPNMDLGEKVSRDKKVVVHCKMGGRSAKAIELIEAKYGHDNLYNLVGGITAYAKEIDPSLPIY